MAITVTSSGGNTITAAVNGGTSVTLGSATTNSISIAAAVVNTISVAQAISGAAGADGADGADGAAGAAGPAGADGADGAGATFQLEDDSGDEVAISNAKEVKFIGAGGLGINWTNTANGTDGDPYDLTFTVGTLNQDTTGSAATLTTARTLGGVSFNGSANIDLPGVNTAGNQNTSGTAAIATTVTITDNESTNEDNAIVFTSGGDVDGGNIGLESDGTCTYNPSTGKITATGFIGALTGQADTVATIAGLAPNTATTQATQGSITSAANLVTVGTIGTGVWQGTAIATAYIADDAVTEAKLANTLLAEIDANTAKVTNVATDLTATANGTSLTINSSDGSNVALPAATNSVWGIMSDDLVVALEANTAKNTNVVGNLSATANGTSLTVETTNGSNVALPAATNTAWGIMSDDHVVAVEANTAKTSFSNLTGEVTSSGAATTIAANIVDEANLKVSNAPTNGYFLSAQSGDTGGLTWAAAGSGSGDITSVVAGTGMTGGATSGAATVNVIGGDGITANSDDIAITPAQTTITSIFATDLIIGEDAQTAIDFGTPNEIDFKINNATELTLSATALYPVTNAGLDLGTSVLEFKDAFFDGTVTSDAFAGPLTGGVTGNADTATALATARAINGVNFDGTAAITVTAAGSTLSDTVTVAKGGTGATSLTNGGVLLGSGTGAVTAMAVLTDGQMIVGDGTTDPVAESGATLRTSIGCNPVAGSSSITTTGALGTGTIATGFGNIDNGSSTLNTGAATVASLVCTAEGTFGGGYGATGATVSTAGVGQFNGALTTDGALTAESLDIGTGGVDVNGTLEANVYTLGGTNIMTGSVLTTAGTISAGVWQGTAVASAYLDADTAHLTTAQTFTGSKTMGTTVKLNFRDGNSYINSPTANDLEIVATDIVLDAATSIALENDTTVTGTLAVSELITPTKGHLYAKGSATHFEAQGDIIKLGTGSTTAGELCYLKADGTWAATDADAVATSGGVLLAMALGTDPDVNGMLLRGMFTLDHDPGTIAGPLYVSTTVGDITGTAPSGSADIVRVVGYCLDSTDGQIWFNPSDDWVVVA